MVMEHHSTGIQITRYGWSVLPIGGKTTMPRSAATATPWSLES